MKDILIKLRKELPSLPHEALAAPRIDRLIFIDREVDLVTPLITQVRVATVVCLWLLRLSGLMCMYG